MRPKRSVFEIRSGLRSWFETGLPERQIAAAFSVAHRMVPVRPLHVRKGSLSGLLPEALDDGVLGACLHSYDLVAQEFPIPKVVEPMLGAILPERAFVDLPAHSGQCGDQTASVEALAPQARPMRLQAPASRSRRAQAVLRPRNPRGVRGGQQPDSGRTAPTVISVTA